MVQITLSTFVLSQPPLPLQSPTNKPKQSKNPPLHPRSFPPPPPPLLLSLPPTQSLKNQTHPHPAPPTAPPSLPQHPLYINPSRPHLHTPLLLPRKHLHSHKLPHPNPYRRPLHAARIAAPKRHPHNLGHLTKAADSEFRCQMPLSAIWTGSVNALPLLRE